jgi:hypothetical protein
MYKCFVVTFRYILKNDRCIWIVFFSLSVVFTLGGMPIVKAPRRTALCDQIVGLSQLIAADPPKGCQVEDVKAAPQLEDSADDPEIGENPRDHRE